jgi:hypothetical protein
MHHKKKASLGDAKQMSPSHFLTASFAPQTEHLPSAVIFGCSLTSALQIPHFTIRIHLHESIWFLADFFMEGLTF